MKFLFLFGALTILGCGAEGPGAGGDGDAGAAACRAPAGCTARLFFSGVCAYSCPANQSVCVALQDGGVARADDILPSGFASAPFTTDLRFDVRNCGACGNACPREAPYCIRARVGSFGDCSPTP